MRDAPGQTLLFQRTVMVPLGDGTYRVVPEGKPQQWVWIRDAAEQLGVSMESVRNWARDGHIVARRVGLRKYQVEMESLRKFVEPFNHLR